MPSTKHFAARMLPLIAALAAATAGAQQAQLYDDAGEIEQALADAQAQGDAARQRAEKLEAEAAQVSEAAEKTASEAAGVAARIQQAEAGIAVQEARVRLVEYQRKLLRERLAEKQRPLVRLTAALQRLSQRPPVLSLFRPGSVRDIVNLRAILNTMIPEVERRTLAVREEIKRFSALQEQAGLAVTELRASEHDLHGRRGTLAALETRQRLASRTASGIADRESERSLALAEQAKDLGELVDELGKAGGLRDKLAGLPGPILRPARPQDALVPAAEPAPSPPSSLQAYVLPLPGKLVAGFGEAQPGHPRSRGIALAARQGAQAVAPAPGQIVFAGPYPGYGSIVIIAHPGGWTSLVTGLAQLDARVGDAVVAGSPLGIAGTGHPIIALELRRNGVPVNPLEYIRPL